MPELDETGHVASSLPIGLKRKARLAARIFSPHLHLPSLLHTLLPPPLEAVSGSSDAWRYFLTGAYERRLAGRARFATTSAISPPNLVNASGNQRSFSLNVKSSSVEKLARLFIDIQQHPDSPSELAHLFQVIDYFNNINPRAFQKFKDTPDFQTKFDSMSSSRRFLAQLENLQIYLETEFNQRRWLNSIFDQSTVNPKSISPLEELQILAKYIKIIEAKYIKKFGMVTESSKLYQYCQPKLFQECLRATKSMMLKLVTSS
ncbi:hypothetical protein PGT21_005152 [Puccinia graminis f. sp. tritici]|uniref:Uncharacterized protein n=1 Tax=Puccinia graminis f. sp. tritici TaxID=56615 RepID=A0A5B0PQS2_PUCGR|nr:hypothetical protein PGT21_005152 [Puccinia graminis f. sp. tritici]